MHRLVRKTYLHDLLLSETLNILAQGFPFHFELLHYVSWKKMEVCCQHGVCGQGADASCQDDGIVIITVECCTMGLLGGSRKLIQFAFVFLVTERQFEICAVLSFLMGPICVAFC